MDNYKNNYKFGNDWFTMQIPSWKKYFLNCHKSHISKVLEVGVYEGRATMWLLENILNKDVSYDMVDNFHDDNFHGDDIEKKLLYNLSFHKTQSFNVYKESSQFILPELFKNGNKYDLIYIDASHSTDDVFVDAYYSHKMLNINGTIIFDDNLWQNKYGLFSVKKATDFFEELYRDEYTQFNNRYQLFYLKNK